MMVTLFQLWSYLDSNAVSDMDTHIVELAKEGKYVHTDTDWMCQIHTRQRVKLDLLIISDSSKPSFHFKKHLHTWYRT